MNKNIKESVVLYTDKSGKVELHADVEKNTLWTTQEQIGQLFKVSSQNITMHLQNIFKSGELNKNSVCKESLHTGKDSKQYLTKLYNLDAIIAVGYRVNSKKATKFRIWATNILRKYLIRGFNLNQRKLVASTENSTTYTRPLNSSNRRTGRKTIESKNYCEI